MIISTPKRVREYVLVKAWKQGVERDCPKCDFTNKLRGAFTIQNCSKPFRKAGWVGSYAPEKPSPRTPVSFLRKSERARTNQNNEKAAFFKRFLTSLVSKHCDEFKKQFPIKLCASALSAFGSTFRSLYVLDVLRNTFPRRQNRRSENQVCNFVSLA
jgi:hypothetical protein